MFDKLNEFVDWFSSSIYEDPKKLRILLWLYRNPFEGTNYPPFIKALGTYGIIPIVSGGIVVLLLLILAVRFIVRTFIKKDLHNEDDPMKLQVLVNFPGVPREDRIFSVFVPEGGDIRNLHRLLAETGRSWISEMQFDTVAIRRDQDSGKLLVDEFSKGWRVWKPMRPIRKNIEAVPADDSAEKREGIIQFRYIKGGG